MATMTRAATAALPFILACVPVSATLPITGSESPVADDRKHESPAREHQGPERTIDPAAIDGLRPVAVFDGEIELLVPDNLRALHPFGVSSVTFEFEESVAKVERQRKLPGPWEGQLVRYQRKHPDEPFDQLAELELALAHRPQWSLAPAGCDDANGQCYIREASVLWIETSGDPERGRAQAVIEVGGSQEEAGPTRYMLLTALVRGRVGYALFYELHADQWTDDHEQLLRASAQSFDAR